MTSAEAEPGGATAVPASPRIKPLPVEEWDERIRDLDLGEVMNAYQTVAHHPRLFRRWLLFAAQLLNDSALPGRQREIVILRTGWNCGSDYEWGQHVKMARAEGVTDEEIIRVTQGPHQPGWKPLDALLLMATDEMCTDRVISDSTYEALASQLDVKQLLDLVFLVGHYELVSMLLRTFRVERDDGVTGVPFPTD